MLRFFGKCGRNLTEKIFDACDVVIREEDFFSKLVCRKCEAFVSKVSDFKQKSKNIQIVLEEEQKCSVKRCTELSPSSKQPSKRAATEVCRKQSSAKQLMFEENPTQNSQGNREQPMKEDSSSIPSPINFEEEVTNQPVQELVIDVDQIVRAVNSMSPSSVAGIIKQHCPNVLSELKILISEELSSACQKLCRRSDGSVLYGHKYENLKEFTFESVWNEMEKNIPFAISVMNAISGKSSTTEDLRVKYSFLYSILMSERWHELSVLKHVNTVLIIEGGCSKKVRCLLFLFCLQISLFLCTRNITMS